jgi:hypothetical protein
MRRAPGVVGVIVGRCCVLVREWVPNASLFLWGAWQTCGLLSTLSRRVLPGGLWATSSAPLKGEDLGTRIDAPQVQGVGPGHGRPGRYPSCPFTQTSISPKNEANVPSMSYPS